MAKQASKAITHGALVSVDQIGRAQVVYAILGISFPTGVGVMTLVSGVTQHMPSMWVFMAVPVSFMATLGAIYLGYMMYHMITPQNRLRYVQTMVPMDLAPEIKVRVTDGKRRIGATLEADEKAPREISRIQFGVSLQNASHFPISAYVDTADTSVGDERPPRFSYPAGRVEIQPGGMIFMVDQPIVLARAVCGTMVEGKLYMRVKYGEPKREKFELVFNGKVQVSTREDGFIQAIVTAWEPVAT